ncbi:MAG: Uncharacterized protein G01um101466_240 [Parcubacteria group bacterium Gr01-1014_66]|nr:MAG: Uncharacterized protein G01um101466_240 [Parcubacteria group bacterium Gr01-1014_66]
MTKNSFVNALVASLYITLVASVLYYGPKIGPQAGAKDTVVVPIAILSLFVLSAAIMGYLFFYQPIRMYVDGEKQKAVHLFLSTVAIFAGITVLILFTLFSGILS